MAVAGATCHPGYQIDSLDPDFEVATGVKVKDLNSYRGHARTEQQRRSYIDCQRIQWSDGSNKTYRSRSAAAATLVRNFPQMENLTTKNDLVILFACDPGRSAYEDDEGGYLTSTLIKHMHEPTPIQMMVVDVSATMMRENKFDQACWLKDFRCSRKFSLSWGDDPSSKLRSAQSAALAFVNSPPSSTVSAGPESLGSFYFNPYPPIAARVYSAPHFTGPVSFASARGQGPSPQVWAVMKDGDWLNKWESEEKKKKKMRCVLTAVGCVVT
eukprot:gene14515-20545_t